MKLPLSWLPDWIDLDSSAEEIAQRLTMRGLEVDSIDLIGRRIEGLVVGRVIEASPHPNADRLTLCTVDAGGQAPLRIVCGARNVRAGANYPLALPGAVMPAGQGIKESTIRGELSQGMLCSAAELGLEADQEGLLELEGPQQPGADANKILALGDAVLDINITPNRADCFSVLGVARELGALDGEGANNPEPAAVVPQCGDEFPISVRSAADCPRFLGRIIRGVRSNARTPFAMKERLRRSGIRPIHPVVDVTNYVMLELGQPLHAYDLEKLTGGIHVRRGGPRESLALLDGQRVRPGEDTLVIADDAGAIGLAGIMGGSSTAVSAETRDVFLECAWFSPSVISGRARALGLHTDASIRFERGVDPELQEKALEYATSLVTAIAGGSPGPVTHAESSADLPERPSVRLRRARLAKVLGAAIPPGEVTRILRGLRMRIEQAGDDWLVTPPGFRFDVEREEDLIEEVARVFGYERIMARPGDALMRPADAAEFLDTRSRASSVLTARGYQEAVTYSFVPADLDRLMGAQDRAGLVLKNPISAEMAVMRQSILTGLVAAVRDNLRRQQSRVRLFEIGPKFAEATDGGIVEQRCVAGMAAGSRFPEQWGVEPGDVDVFDVKADIEALLAALGCRARAAYRREAHPALHPGRSGRIFIDDKAVGWMGELHPKLCTTLELPACVAFEIELDRIAGGMSPAIASLSVFPSVRRDLAVVVPRDVEAGALLSALRASLGAVLVQAFVFDIYTGPQVGDTEKSVAMGLILQDPSRTLTEQDAQQALESARIALSRAFNARFRE